MLKTENLAFSYGGSADIVFPDIDCGRGEHWLVLGQSGCGKTTLLHLLAGLRTPTRGKIMVNEVDMTTLSGPALDGFRGREIGVIFQQSYFVRSLSVEENLLLAQSLGGSERDRDSIKQILSRLNIAHKLNARTGDLSVGEQQRVAIARALINRPTLILADEPTSALDDLNTDEVLKLIREQAKAANAALLIVTHDTRLKDEFGQQIHLKPINAN